MTDLPARLDALFAPYRRSGAPGCTVAISQAGRIVHRAGYGLADVEHGVAHRPSTPMPIGSVTKQFTCAALLSLVDDCILSLDDPIDRWVDGLAAVGPRPTLRQLMMHTGGVRCYLDSWAINGYRTMPAAYPLAFQRGQCEPNFEPGTAIAYSNGGYLLLSAAIERAANEPFESVLAQRLFAPLGMHDTCVPRRRTPVRPDLATLYMPDDLGGWRHAIAMAEEMLGDGGMVSTVDDLMRWARWSASPASGPLLGRLAGTEELDDDASRYGFGVIAERWRGIRVISHTGAMPGASSLLMSVPHEGIDIALLFNRNAPVVRIGQAVVEALLGPRLAATRPDPSAADHRAILGDYVGDATGLAFRFVDVDGRLEIGLFGGASFPVSPAVPRSDALSFVADIGTGNVRFRVADVDDGRANSVDYLDGGVWYRASRIGGAESAVDVPGQRLRLASFRCDDCDATMRFSSEGGGDIVRFRGAFGDGVARAASIAPSQVLLRFDPFDSGMLATLEHDAEGVSAVVVSTGRTRRMRFARLAGNAVR